MIAMPMNRLTTPESPFLEIPAESGAGVLPAAAGRVRLPQRISSRHLLRDRRVIEIEHGGRVYQLRITQRNKLILTA